MARMKTTGNVAPKIPLNTGTPLDLITGKFIVGEKGENILVGGLPNVMSNAGPTNNFKTYISNHIILKALNNIRVDKAYYYFHDTELNLDIAKVNSMGVNYENLDDDLLHGPNKHMEVSDAETKPGDEWKTDYINYVDEHLKEPYIIFEGMIDPYTKQTLKRPSPNFFCLDTVTELRSSMAERKMNNYKKDDGSDNTDDLIEGKFRASLVKQIPLLAIRSNSYIIITAQVGEKIDMSGQWDAKPMKKLPALRSIDAIKGVPRQFYSLTQLGLLFHSTSNIKNSDKTTVLYPSKEKDYMPEDLNLVNITVLRNKLGSDAFSFLIVISKDEGVLEAITDYHMLKDKKFGNGYGFFGNNTTFKLYLYPSRFLSRPTIRDLSNNDKKLTRALYITREMFQLTMLKPHMVMNGTLCTPEVLYKDIIEKGYDWDMVLETTPIYQPKHYSSGDRYLSILDLLEMRLGKYHPYWLDKDKKTILKKYRG